MQYVGIDIAKRAHVAGARLEDGTPHGRSFEFANDRQGFASLLKRLRELGAGPGDCLLVMESTGHYWLALWEFVVARAPPCPAPPGAGRMRTRPRGFRPSPWRACGAIHFGAMVAREVTQTTVLSAIRVAQPPYIC